MFKDTKSFFSFSVKDLAQAQDFYAKTLGLAVKETPMGLDIGLAGGASLFVYPKPNHQPATFTVLNFRVPNVEQAVDALSERGVRFEVYDEGPLKTNAKGIAKSERGPTIAWFKDPAGNVLSVVEAK